jgi:hypothetical protein
MKFLIIAITATVIPLLALYTVLCVALAWIHHPEGIIKAMKRKKKKKAGEKP